MSDPNQNKPDLDSEGLPPSVRRYFYEGKDQFCRILTLERERLLDSMRNSREVASIDTASGSTKPGPNIETTEYIIFSIDPSTFEQDFIGSHSIPAHSIRTSFNTPTLEQDFESPDIIPTYSIRTSFNPTTELLVVKMVTGEHTQIAFAVHKAIDEALQQMGLDETINNYACVDINVGGETKQADMGWGPRRPPRGYPKRPTVVLEVGVSETRSKLHRDIDLWLDPTRGNANVAIAIKVNRQRPMISIDKWIWDAVNGKSLNCQHIEVAESDTDEVKVSGGPLIIPFHLLFLRQPQAPRETDVVIDQEWLQNIAEWGWDMQFQ